MSASTVIRTVDRAQRDRQQWGDRTPVVVVVRRLSAGHTIATTDVGLQQLPRALVPADATRSVASVVGNVAATNLSDGQIVTPGLLASRSVSPMALKVGRGRVGVTVETGAARPELSAGSSVVVIASPDAQARAEVASVSGVVVSIADRFVTISVAEHDAPALANLMAGGPVYVALKGA